MEIKGPVGLTASCRLCPWGTERAPEWPFWNYLSLQDTVCEYLDPVCCSMSSSNCCFLTCI